MSNGKWEVASRSTNSRPPLFLLENYTQNPLNLLDNNHNQNNDNEVELNVIENNNGNNNQSDVKLSKSEQEYEYYKNLANNEDFAEIIPLNILRYAGKDTLGRPIVMILPANLNVKTTNLDLLLLYFIKVLDPIVDNDYVLVFVATNAGKENRPSMAWLKKAYSIFNRKYKKNLKTLYIVHPNIWIRVTLRLVRPFISNKFWKKVLYVDDINQMYRSIERCDIQFPEYVIKYNAKVNSRKDVFGTHLPEVIEIEHNPTGIPEVVEKSVIYLRNCCDVEGIFRKNANVLQVEELQICFNKGEDVDLSTIDDPHAVAALLKSFLRQLPDPLFTYDLYDAFIQTQLASGNKLEVWLFTVKKLLIALPAINQRVIKHIFELLVEISNHSDKNLMTTSNLAIVFAPNLLKSRDDNLLLAMQHTPILNSLVKQMIENHVSLWN